MGIDHTIFIIVGFEIDLSYIFHVGQVGVAPCKHWGQVAGTPKFCPHCGVRFKLQQRVDKNLQEGISEEILGGGCHPLTEGSEGYPPVTVWFFEDTNCKNQIALAGCPVAVVNDPRYENMTEMFPVPVLPKEENLRGQLDDLGVPYKEGTFKMYRINWGR